MMTYEITEISSGKWSINGIPIKGKLILAPMEGYTDMPFRRLCKQFGSSSLSVTEFINAIDVVNGHPYLVKNHAAFSPDERPVAIQIFDNVPDRIVAAAWKLMEYGPDFIDINMGCSVKQVANRGAGAGLLKEPEKIARIFSMLSHQLPIPVTGKIRLGWDDASRNYRDIARIIEDNGGKAITVHGRLRSQNFQSPATWDEITEVKQLVKIPVIGNGDIQSLEDAQRMIDYTKCDAVMVGRVAIGNPWVFLPARPETIPFTERTHVMQTHLQSMIDFYGETIAVVQFRKHAVAYLSPYNLKGEQRRVLLTTTTRDDFLRELDNLPFK